jgi:LmbE family N-acetylglucosaminyl deacetylase
LDDAVLSCGQRLAAGPGSTVVTVFTGGPSTYDVLTDWDVSCGFRAGDDVMAARRAEDRAALARLGATPVWLGLVEAQYGGSLAVEPIVAALADALAAWSDVDVLVPLGLHHPAHEAVADAAVAVAPTRPDLRWWLYADQPYAALYPDVLAARLVARGLDHTAPVSPPDVDARWKRAALREYPTQLRPLAGSWRLALAPERTWPLTMEG